MNGLALTLTLLGLPVAVATLVKVVIPVCRWLWDVGGRVMGAIDNLAGREPRVDRATGKTIEGIPAIGERFAGIEEKLDRVANVNDRLDRVEARVDIVESTQAALIAGNFERGANAALIAVETQRADTIDVDPT